MNYCVNTLLQLAQANVGPAKMTSPVKSSGKPATMAIYTLGLLALVRSASFYD